MTKDDFLGNDNSHCQHVPVKEIKPGENNFALCGKCGFLRDEDKWFDPTTFTVNYLVYLGLDDNVRLFVRLMQSLNEVGVPCSNFTLEEYIEMANQQKNKKPSTN